MSSVTETTPRTLPLVVIRPPTRWLPIDLRELWQYRELVLVLVKRDLQSRYQQSLLGLAWFGLQPLMTALIFTIIFGQFARLPSDGAPYLLFFLSGLLVWSAFATTVSGAVQSLVVGANLVRKVYFPRMVLPASSALAASADLSVGLAVLGAWMAWEQVPVTLAALLLPCFVAIALVLGLGLGLWLSALHAQYRDVAYGVQYALQTWLYLSPIAYASSIVPERFRALYSLNPMAPVVEGFRWAALGTPPPDPASVCVAALVAVVVLVSGAYFFRSREATLADVV